jgi:peptidoglycan/LPS O-acetylase OafA/YrhL
MGYLKTIFPAYRLTQNTSLLLDLIRGLSAQIVVIGHGISFFGIFPFLQPPHFPWIQNIAVLVFFILSGFLITYSLAQRTSENNCYSFRSYFIDRFSRIYSAFIPALLFILILDLTSRTIAPGKFIYEDTFTPGIFAGNLLMLQNNSSLAVPLLEKISIFGSARPLWTLALEWWIYLLYGFFVLCILQKRKPGFQNILILPFLLAIPLLTLYDNYLPLYWFLGALAYYGAAIKLRTSLLGFKILLFLFFIAAAGFRVSNTMMEYEPLFALLVAAAILTLISLSAHLHFRPIPAKIVKFQASYSYTLYLVHYSIIDFIYTHFSNRHDPYLLFFVSLLAANIFSIFIGRLTEIRLTKKVKAYLYSLNV